VVARKPAITPPQIIERRHASIDTLGYASRRYVGRDGVDTLYQDAGAALLDHNDVDRDQLLRGAVLLGENILIEWNNPEIRQS